MFFVFSKPNVFFVFSLFSKTGKKIGAVWLLFLRTDFCSQGPKIVKTSLIKEMMVFIMVVF